MNAHNKYIEWEPLQSVAGLGFRRFNAENDYRLYLDLFNGCKEVNHIDRVMTLEDIKNDEKWTKNYDIHQNFLFVELEETPVGYFGYWWEMEIDGKVVYNPFGNLLPDFWGRGIAALMLQYAEDKCKEIAALKHGGMDRRLRIGLNEKASEKGNFLLGNGYAIERYFFAMDRPIDLPLGEHPLPEGVEIRSAEPAHFRAIWEADFENFKDHWGASDPSEEMYEAWQKDRMFLPSLWKIAWQGDNVVGIVQNMLDEEENQSFNRKRGYTENISVQRKWRGKGVASALIAESIRMFRDMGMDHTHLGVDADSPTRALKLYEDLGYVVDNDKTFIMLFKPF